MLSKVEGKAASGLAGGSPPIAADIPAREGRRAEGYLLGPRVLPLTYLK